MGGRRSALSEQIRRARSGFDLTEPSHQKSVEKLAEAFLEAGLDEAQKEMEGWSAPLEARMAVLLADSRGWLVAARYFSAGTNQLTWPVSLRK